VNLSNALFTLKYQKNEYCTLVLVYNTGISIKIQIYPSGQNRQKISLK